MKKKNKHFLQAEHDRKMKELYRMKLVYLESPYGSKDEEIIKRNIEYAKACMWNCYLRNEAPFVSHLLYTQILDDNNPEQRKWGIEAGLSWGIHAEKTIVFCDYGITDGMIKGIKRADKEGRKVEIRYLYQHNCEIQNCFPNISGCCEGEHDIIKCKHYKGII